MRRRPYPGLAVIATALLALTACTGDAPAADPDPSAPSTPQSTSAAPESGGDTAPPGGTLADPAEPEPEPALLEWRPVPGSTDDTTTVAGEWRLVVTRARDEAVLSGPDGDTTLTSPRGFSVSDTLIDATHAVVVHQHDQEQQPSRATVVTLASGEQHTLDGRSQPRTVNGGTWALSEGQLVHATTQGRSYCLARVGLADLSGEVVWCAEPRHGFTGARLTPYGLTVMSFDDSRPSCRTVGTLTGDGLEPFEGPTDCKAWEAVAGEGGYVWAEVPKERRIEAARVTARSADGWFDLGESVSGSLTWCGDSAWWAAEPVDETSPARLMRWDGSAFTVAYESPSGGEAFVTAPRCGGDTLTVTALTEAGDEQVFARIR